MGLIALLTVWAALNVADMWTTTLALRNPNVREKGPLMALLLRWGGLPLMHTGKTVLVVALTWAALHFGVWWVLIPACVWLAYVVLGNWRNAHN